ncbi:hypothetical protein BG004_002060 [Podila humilis]|nr:hypothetical protein BG004_002060 [Podila humilis]
MATHIRSGDQEPPAFEHTQENAELQREIIDLIQSQDRLAQETLTALEECSAHYREEDSKLKEILEAFGISKNELSPPTQATLGQLSEFAMALKISDMSVSSFQQGLSVLLLDTLSSEYDSIHSKDNSKHLHTALDGHVEQAQKGLEDLHKLRESLAKEWDTVHDMEIRNQRRSVESIQSEIQQQLRQDLKKESFVRVDVENQGLTVSQIKSQEAAVAGLQNQVQVQARNLEAYGELPPDYTLATLKLNETKAKLDQLMEQRELLVQRLADDL